MDRAPECSINKNCIKAFHTACKHAGIQDFTFHDLRRTFDTPFLNRTKDIHTLAQVMGHGTTYMTERYSHLLDEVKRDAMIAFGGT
jgi:integrase